MCGIRNVPFDNPVSRRDFLKLLAVGATTLAFGSIFGFSCLLSTNNKNGRGISTGVGSIPQAVAQSTLGTFVLGPNTGSIAIHAANLANGKIFYAAGSGFSSTYEKVLCAGGTLRYDTADPDGRWKGLSSAFEYDPGSDSLAKVQSMKHGRWYPYCITLDEGKVLTIGGFDEWGCNNALCEIYNPVSKSWSVKYDSTTSNTYCVGSCNTSAPHGLPCYGGSGQGTKPPVSLYPRALFMPTGL